MLVNVPHSGREEQIPRRSAKHVLLSAGHNSTVTILYIVVCQNMNNTLMAILHSHNATAKCVVDLFFFSPTFPQKNVKTFKFGKFCFQS